MNLKDGFVTFSSQVVVSEQQVSDLFTTSGFEISHYTTSQEKKDKQPSVGDLNFEFHAAVFNANQYQSIYQAIGNIASKTAAYIVIKAPDSLEETLLKPLLMGHKETITIRFIDTDTDQISIELFELD